MKLPIVEPIIPRLGKHVPVGREWLYEVKLDGFRGVFYFDGREALFRSKRNNRMPRFADLARTIALELDVRDVILDGEVVVMGKGGPDFYRLMFRRGQPMYAAFDVCWLNGRDLRARPLRERKRILEQIVRDSAIVSSVLPENCATSGTVTAKGMSTESDDGLIDSLLPCGAVLEGPILCGSQR